MKLRQSILPRRQKAPRVGQKGRCSLRTRGVGPRQGAVHVNASAKGFLYQAASWKTARRVVTKVEFQVGELFPRVPSLTLI